MITIITCKFIGDERKVLIEISIDIIIHDDFILFNLKQLLALSENLTDQVK